MVSATNTSGVIGITESAAFARRAKKQRRSATRLT
jgi:hypothetical protein